MEILIRFSLLTTQNNNKKILWNESKQEIFKPQKENNLEDNVKTRGYITETILQPELQ